MCSRFAPTRILAIESLADSAEIMLGVQSGETGACAVEGGRGYAEGASHARGGVCVFLFLSRFFCFCFSVVCIVLRVPIT